MILLIPIFLNILLTIILLYFNKINKFKNLSLLCKQLIIGFLFGTISAVSSEIGINYLDIIVNIRDASPICAGLIFGPISGIIAGFIGGIYRVVSVFWGAGTYTVIACSISTIMAGIIVALLRKFIFEDKRPNLLYGLGITVFIEIFHMLMIFITNMSDDNTAFLFVQKCTLPMIIANAIAVVTSMISANYLTKVNEINNNKIIKISHIFEKWIFIFIFVGFIITSSFIYYLQEKMTNLQIRETFTVTINDVYKDIKDKSDDSLLEKTKLIKNIYLQDKTKPLEEIALEYDVSDINIVQADGLIKNSTQEEFIDSFNMNDTDQSKEFMILVTDDSVNEFVQDFGAMGIDGKTMRKFAGVTLEDGGFIQVGYNTKQFRDNLDNFVIDVTKNRKVGATGFIAVCDENLNLVTSTDRNGHHISSLGLEPNEEMNSGLSASKIYKTEIKNNKNDYKEKYIYVFSFVENYCIIAAIPEVEAMLMRDASIYLNSFSLIILLTI